jgi:hypothetical protein
MRWPARRIGKRTSKKSTVSRRVKTSSGSPARIFRGRTRAEERTEKQAARREKVALLRAAVFARARWRCEGESEPGVRCGEPAVHMHHLRGGIGRRRQEESVETCAALCLECHARVHHNPKRRT